MDDYTRTHTDTGYEDDFIDDYAVTRMDDPKKTLGIYPTIERTRRAMIEDGHQHYMVSDRTSPSGPVIKFYEVLRPTKGIGWNPVIVEVTDQVVPR